MSDVAIVGLGIHPFGRHAGVSGLRDGGGRRPRARSRDAGIGWEDVDFAAGGSDAAGNADTTVSVLGLTGVPFINVKQRLRDRRLGADHRARDARRPARPRSRWSSASTSTRRARSTRCPRSGASAPGTARPGLMLTTQFFAMKIQRYMAEHGDQRVDARQGRGEGVRQRRAATRTPGAASRSPRRRCSAPRWSTTR